MEKFAKFYGIFGPLVIYVVTLGGVLSIIGFDRVGLALLWVHQFWDPSISQEPSVENYLLSIGAIAFAYSVFATITGDQSPLTTLQTDVQIEVSGAGLYCQRVSRRQLIRANMRNVTAVYGQLIPASGGTVPEGSIHADVTCKGRQKLESEFRAEGGETSGWEYIHRIKPNIPFPIFAPLIPDYILRTFNDTPIINKCVIVRNISATYNEKVMPD